MLKGTIKFKDIGNITEADIELKSFSVFVGKNNTGKTFLANALFYLHSKHMKSLIDSFLKKNSSSVDGKDILIKTKNLLKMIFEEFNNYPFYNRIYKNKKFNDSRVIFDYKQVDVFHERFDLHEILVDYFKENEMVVKLLMDVNKLDSKKFYNNILKTNIARDRNENIEMVLNTFFDTVFGKKFDVPYVVAKNILDKYFCVNKDVYMFPVERAGINTFLFDVTREINTFNICLENYLQLINELKNISVDAKSDYFDIACSLEQALFNGKIELTKDFLPQDKKLIFTDTNNNEIGSEFFSSSINELSTLILYLKYKAKKGDIVFIDEPEISLHPDAQRILVKYLAVLNNEGIKFVLITHSDYIVKELSHTISLGRKKSGCAEKDFIEMLKENNLSDYIIGANDKIYMASLEKESVLYSLNQNDDMHTVVKKIEPTLLGFNEDIFNNSINQTNIVSNTITSFVLNEKDEDIFSDI